MLFSLSLQNKVIKMYYCFNFQDEKKCFIFPGDELLEPGFQTGISNHKVFSLTDMCIPTPVLLNHVVEWVTIHLLQVGIPRLGLVRGDAFHSFQDDKTVRRNAQLGVSSSASLSFPHQRAEGREFSAKSLPPL